MHLLRRFYLLLAVATICGSDACAGQSLGDVARQERLRRGSQSNSAQVVVTNDEMPPHGSVDSTDAVRDLETAHSSSNRKSELQLHEKIISQKHRVLDLEKHLQYLQKSLDERNSIGTVHVYEHVDHLNQSRERPQIRAIKTDMNATEIKLRKEKAVLDALQERARKLGFGNAFYDPD